MSDAELTSKPTFRERAAKAEWKLMQRLAANVHRFNRVRGWSQSELARRAGVDRAQVSRQLSPEEGGRGLQLDTLTKYALAFEVPVWTLLLPIVDDDELDDETATAQENITK